MARSRDNCRACGEFWPCVGSEFDPSHTANAVTYFGCYLDGRNDGYAVTETTTQIVARFPTYAEAKAHMDARAANTEAVS